MGRRQTFDLLGGMGESPALELNTDLGYCDESLIISCEFCNQSNKWSDLIDGGFRIQSFRLRRAS